MREVEDTGSEEGERTPSPLVGNHLLDDLGRDERVDHVRLGHDAEQNETANIEKASAPAAQVVGDD